MSVLPATLPQPTGTPRRLFHFYPGYSDQPVPQPPPAGAVALCGHVKENVHGTLAALRGMCSDECPHTEIDRVLAALDDEVMDKAHVFRELP